MSVRFRRRKRRSRRPRPPVLYLSRILEWADTYQRRHGRWPSMDAGIIPGTGGDTWRRVDSALRLGLRGLPGDSSLVRLLAEERGARNQKELPRLSHKQILAWADAYQKRTGTWPKETSGKVAEAPLECWHAVDRAMRAGVRGLPGTCSLAQLLAKHRGVRNIQSLPRLSLTQILTWADQHRRRTGAWPNPATGQVNGTGDTWGAVQAALQIGRRGLPGGSSIARVLAEHRGVRNPRGLPSFKRAQILAWADAHYERTGIWPHGESGPIVDAPGETWGAVDAALKGGWRGLRGGSSLARVLLKHRGVRPGRRPSVNPGRDGS